MPRKDRKKEKGEKAPLLGRDGTIGAKPSANAQPALDSDGYGPAADASSSAFASPLAEYNVVAVTQEQDDEEMGKKGLPAAAFTSSASAAAGVSCESALFRNRRRTGKSVKQRVSRFFGLEDGDMPLQVAVRPSSSSNRPQPSTAQRQAGALRPSHGSGDGGGGYHGRARRGEEDIVAIDDGEYALASPLQAVPEDAPKAPNRNAPYFHGPMTAEDAKDRMKTEGADEEDGVFLVRMDVSGNYVLVISCEGRLVQFLCDRGERVPKKYTLGESAPGFSTMDALIHFYYLEKDGLPCCLTRACPKPGFARSKSRNSKRTFVDMRLKANTTNDEGVTAEQEAAAALAESRTALSETASVDGDGAGDKSAKAGVSPRPTVSYVEYVDAQLPAKGRYEIVGMSQFEPWFIRLVTAVQLLVVAILCLKGGVDPITFKPRVVERQVDTGFDPTFIDGTIIFPPNMFIGPDTKFLISWGAKYVPCMRKDISIFSKLSEQREKEKTNYGCCQRDLSGYVLCGQTTRDECSEAGQDFSGEGTYCKDQALMCNEYRLRPCCTAFNATCEITTKDYCDFVEGIWNDDAERCSDVSCLKGICAFQLDAEKPNQWYRFFIATFLHAGLIHYFLNMILQVHLGMKLERNCGWFRMALMYIISGLGGNLLSCIFSPQSVQVGASGSIYGLLGIQLVELLHTWPALKRPWRELSLLGFEIIIFLLIGTLPFVDNFAHVGGFGFGVLSGIVFLPYITFGPWDKFRKRCLLVICLPGIIVLFLVGMVLFYRVQKDDFCPQCKYIQCIPYVENFCDENFTF